MGSSTLSLHFVKFSKSVYLDRNVRKKYIENVPVPNSFDLDSRSLGFQGAFVFSVTLKQCSLNAIVDQTSQSQSQSLKATIWKLL